MKRLMLKQRTAGILAFVTVFLSVFQPFSIPEIYAAGSEDTVYESEPELLVPEEETSAAGEASVDFSGPDDLEAVGDGEEEEVKFTVSFYNFDNSSLLKEIVVPKGSLITAVEPIPVPPEQQGKTFKGWVHTQGATDVVNFANEPIYDNKKYYQYHKDLFPVTFYLGYGSPSSYSVDVEDGDKVLQPENPTREGWRFINWYTDQTYSTPFDFANTPITAATPVYADWIEQCYVTFNPNSGRVITQKGESFYPVTVSVDKGSPIEVPGAKRQYYDFQGWFDNLDQKLESGTTINSTFTVNAKWNRRTVKVSYNVSGIKVKDEVIPEGSTELHPPENVTVPTGCELTGWTKNGVEWAVGTDKAEENMILEAHFEPVIYRVNYLKGKYSINPVMPDPVDVQLGNKITAPAYPVDTTGQYVCIGWFKDIEATVSWNFDKTVSEDDADENRKIYIYAGWKPKTYQVSFVTNIEGVSVDSIEVGVGKTIENAPVPSPDPEHQILEGWYQEPGFHTPFKFGKQGTGTSVIKDYTLYARWSAANRITLSVNGGTVKGQNPFKIVSGNTLQEGMLPEVTRYGYTLEGWYSDPELEDAYEFGHEIIEDLQLYAKWNVNTYTVRFYDDVGGNLYARRDGVPYDSLLTGILPENPTKEHFDFDCWKKYNDKKTKLVPWVVSTDRMPAEDLDLFAGWKSKTVTVSFDSMSNDAIVIPAKVTVGEGQTVNQPTASYVGHKLEGWYTKKIFRREYKWDFSTGVNADMWLYAYWTDALYKVTFNTNGGSAVQSQTVTYNTSASRPKQDPSKAGYVFDKWYADKDLTQEYDFSTPVTKDITIYAGWKDAPSYKIQAVVDGSGGSIAPAGIFMVKEGLSQTFTFSPDSGYEVDKLLVSGNETAFSGNQYVLKDIRANYKIVVSFRKIPEVIYTISASCADSFGMISPVGKIPVKKGETKKFYFDPMDGYVLDYVEVDGTKTEVSKNSYTFENVTSNHTIIAHFKEKKIEPIIPVGYFKVVFLLDGKEYQSVVVEEGQTLTAPKEPEKDKSVFMGWYMGNRKWDFMDPVTEDLTLTAKFLSETVSDGDVHSGLDDMMNISDPNDITMVKGQTYQFGKGNWSSSDSGILSVGKSSGTAKAKNPSNIPVTITNSNTLPSTVYRIRVIAPEISPKKLTMGVGTTEKLQLLYADGMNVAWRSSNPKVVSVEEGHISSKSTGTAKISAYVNGKAYTSTITVKDTYTAPANFDNVTAFTLRPTQTLNLKKISVGGLKPNQLDWRLFDESNTRRVNKSGWISWEDDVLKINVNGVLTAKSCGKTTIIGRRGDSRVKIIDVTVGTIPKKSETYLNVGKNEKLTYYKVVNSKAAWDATNLGKVVKLGMENTTKGRVYGLNVGRSTVTCSYNGMTYSTLVHVENPVLSLEDSRLARTGENHYMMFIRSRTRCHLEMPDVEQEITWKTGNKKIAFVDESGIVEGRKAGVTTVSTKINGTTVKVKVYVTE